MRYLRFVAVLSTAILPQISHAQTPASVRPATTWTLPSSLADRKLPDTVMQETGGNVDAIFSRVAGDNAELTTTTQGAVLSLPSSLAAVVTKATQASSAEAASAMGLGLCMATSSLMSAANDPATAAAESQSARDLARAIMTSVASAQSTSATPNAGISNSFGISANANGGASITCKSINGEVVATTSVNAAAATSNAGVGLPTSESTTAAVGAAGADAATGGGGGASSRIAFPSFATASFTVPALTQTSSTSVISVPGPDAGMGIIPLLALAGIYAKKSHSRRKTFSLKF